MNAVLIIRAGIGCISLTNFFLMLKWCRLKGLYYKDLEGNAVAYLDFLL